MANILITERQLELITKDQASKNGVSINESEWYNTIGDIAGIIDPTGVVDLVNGVSYWSQGDKLFALLSWISVVPYVGDVLAKPVVGALKVGGKATRAFRGAVAAGDAVKIAETAKVAGGPIAKMVESAPTWGGKLLQVLKTAVGKVPGIGGPLVRAVEEFVGIFTKASKEIKLPTNISRGGKIINVEKGLSSLEKQKLMKSLEKEQGKLFRGNKDVRNSWLKYMKSDASLGQKIWAGVPRLFGGNPATRSLMKRTKTYLGFLDWLGFGNFVGPDELLGKMPNAEQKWNEYSQTPEAQKTWNQEIGETLPNQSMGQSSGPSSSPSSSSGGPDPIQGFMSDIFGGQLRNAALMAI
jgi:hypothetical protein